MVNYHSINALHEKSQCTLVDNSNIGNNIAQAPVLAFHYLISCFLSAIINADASLPAFSLY